eukprot:956282-Amphidinium_carterae.1
MISVLITLGHKLWPCFLSGQQFQDVVVLSKQNHFMVATQERSRHPPHGVMGYVYLSCSTIGNKLCVERHAPDQSFHHKPYVLGVVALWESASWTVLSAHSFHKPQLGAGQLLQCVRDAREVHPQL